MYTANVKCSTSDMIDNLKEEAKIASLVKYADKSEVIYYASVLSSVNVDDLDVSTDDRILSLKKQDIPIEEKVSKAKEIALAIAHEKMHDEMIDGTHLTDNNIQDVKLHTDRMDWYSLFEEE